MARGGGGGGGAADVLFGGDPTTASEAALEAVAAEVPSSELDDGVLDHLVQVLVETGLAESNGAARRLLQQGGVRANGVTLEPESDLRQVELLHGRWLLLRRGRTSHHVVRISRR
jgi:tyrosyl-tRNA synthetase